MRRILLAKFHAQAISVILGHLVLFLPIPLRAQACSPASQEKGIFQRVDVFPVMFVVHDKKGKAVGGLQRSDFVVLADGKPQNVIFFHSIGQTDNTCTGIVIDRSGSRQYAFPNAEFAPIENFVASDLDSNHGAFLVAFGDHPLPIGGHFTSSAQLGQELQNVASMGPGGMTARNDAIELASRELANAQGLRILLMVGEGDDNHSKSTPEEAIDSALKARAAVYFIQLLPDPPSSDPQRAWDFASFPEKITAETGGEVFPVHKKDDFEKAFAEFKEALSNLYEIGFLLPTNLKKNRILHTLQIKTTRKDLRVVAPTKFYLPNQERAVTANPER